MAERIVRSGIRQIALLSLLTALASIFCSCGSDDTQVKSDSVALASRVELTPANVRAELLKIMQSQERARDISDSVVSLQGWNTPEARKASRTEHLLDSIAMARLDAYVQKYGWPGRSIVGEEATLGAFLVVQHASTGVQERYLPILREETDRNEFAPAWLAMLEDRVAMRQQRPQTYGTQLWNDPSTGELVLYPILDTTNIDQRRAEVGLQPLADYLEQMGASFGADR
jgi:hypothetical protein